jgi:flagellar biosynthesis protein FlhA
MALGEAASATRNPALLTEYVRQAVRRAVIRPYLNRAGELPAWFVDPALERAVEAAVEHGEQTSPLTLAPQALRDILNRVSSRIVSAETPVSCRRACAFSRWGACDPGATERRPE